LLATEKKYYFPTPLYSYSNCKCTYVKQMRIFKSCIDQIDAKKLLASVMKLMSMLMFSLLIVSACKFTQIIKNIDNFFRDIGSHHPSHFFGKSGSYFCPNVCAFVPTGAKPLATNPAEGLHITYSW